ncbi:MAG: hypothetical protein MRZ54_12320 [Clostridiales bacterium]|nr:hypothetical protein [Clostridiales bacterium]
MKKALWTILLLTLALTLCAAAQAQTTGVAVDGKVYTFTGGEGTYKADGKTFIIGAETVTIQEAGKPDRVLKTVNAQDAENVRDDAAVFIEQGTECTTAVSTECTESAAGGESDADTELFVPYAEFGLRYDAANDALYYQGQRVRIFEDSYPLDGQVCAGIEHVDPLGTVDVKAQRDLSAKAYNADGSFDPSGKLVGLYALTDEEFEARLLGWVKPAQEAATEGYGMTGEEKQQFFAPYAAFGLSYDAEADALSYQGKRVRRFTDIRQSNGEPLEGGSFQGVMTHIAQEDGEIDVETTRDFTRLDAAGEGTLIGMTVKEVR